MRNRHEIFEEKTDAWDIARIQEISVREPKQNIEIFQQVFGIKTPTPDEYILKMAEFSLK